MCPYSHTSTSHSLLDTANKTRPSSFYTDEEKAFYLEHAEGLTQKVNAVRKKERNDETELNQELSLLLQHEYGLAKAKLNRIDMFIHEHSAPEEVKKYEQTVQYLQNDLDFMKNCFNAQKENSDDIINAAYASMLDIVGHVAVLYSKAEHTRRCKMYFEITALVLGTKIKHKIS